MENSFVIDENKRCYLNGQELNKVVNVDIKNINAIKSTEVTITVDVDSIDVKYKARKGRQYASIQHEKNQRDCRNAC